MANTLHDVPGLKRLLSVLVPVAFAAALAFFVFGRSEAVSALAIPRTEDFPSTLIEANIFEGPVLADLVPKDGFHLMELESSLFVDGSDKQRLISIPEGEQIIADGDGLPVFPEGTTLVKTFFYPFDERDPNAGRRILETRLLVLTNNEWNVATYVWNDEQTNGTVLLDGLETEVTWTLDDGSERTIDYQIPDEAQCVSCHQQSNAVTPIGPELRNLNFEVTRSGDLVNQLSHYQRVGILGDVDITTVGAMVDYFDESLPISERARAYLDINCAHCHNPEAWERPANTRLDFRWQTTAVNEPRAQTINRAGRQLSSGNMPFFGTTIVDDEGADIISGYIAELAGR